MGRLLSPTTLVVLLYIVTQSATPGAADGADYLTYAEFIDAVEKGTVVQVKLDQFSRIIGTHKVDGVDNPFECYANSGSANDLLLNRLLNEHSVPASIASKNDSSPLPGGFFAIIWILVPIVTLVFVLRIHWRINRILVPDLQ